MEMKYFHVEIDRQSKEYPEGTSYLEIAKEYQNRFENDIVLVLINGKLQELRKKLKKDCRMEFITTADEMGNKTYKRGVSFLLVK